MRIVPWRNWFLHTLQSITTEQHTDILSLDEISECKSTEVGKIIYGLGNGLGKQRASRSGAARRVNRWRCVVLSSDERTVETSIRAGGGKAKSGQTARLVDVPRKPSKVGSRTPRPVRHGWQVGNRIRIDRLAHRRRTQGRWRRLPAVAIRTQT